MCILFINRKMINMNISDFKIKDGKVTYNGDVYLYTVDKAPEPPEFKFGKVENIEITGGANIKNFQLGFQMSVMNCNFMLITLSP